MTKVIKEEFEKLESLKIGDDSFACNTSLEIFYEEFNRMSIMGDDLFTYEVEIFGPTNIPYNGSLYKECEVDLTDEESSDSDDEDEVAKIFRIDTNVFDFETHIEYEMEREDEERCELFDQERSVCNIRRFEMIKYSFSDDEEYVAVKENEYDDLTSTSKEAIHTYQEIFRMMDEGWIVTHAE
ncbi:hypothetical protein Tco_1313338 [Tanacetum coccineum]